MDKVIPMWPFVFASLAPQTHFRCCIPFPINEVTLSDNLGYNNILPHLVESGLQTFVGGVDPPHHTQVFLSLLLHQVPEQALKSVILVVPRAEHVKTCRHHLLKLVVRDVHQTPGTQNLPWKRDMQRWQEWMYKAAVPLQETVHWNWWH